ncbi:MAG TPA: hypothetical protein VFE61_24480 [Candidatus Sulfotelmatobacter sp.]|nr:hypothetical protein [Candidatus Sulfotelmatobacter sp.]
MRRLLRIARWFLVASAVGATGLIFAHIALRPSLSLAQSEQYAVYSSYIQPGLTGNSHDLGSPDGPIVIYGRTIVSNQFVSESTFNQYRFLLGTARHADGRISQLRKSLLIEFFASNLLNEQLEERFTLSATYHLATDQETNLYPYEQFWKRFPKSYGYLTFSRIGFNRDLTEAFFYTEHIGGLCGEGKYVFMRKLSGQWIVEATAPVWIS